MSLRKFYSQTGQDRWVAEEVFNYKLEGYFLDIGAFDGVFLSNTFWLERFLGWSGICVEADPKTFKMLKRNRRCMCLNACVGRSGENIEFLSGQGPYSGQSTVTHGDYSSARGGRVSLKSTPLSAILEQANAPQVIDYLSLDVEGMEEQVISTFPFDNYHFRCATIERPSESLRSTMRRQGYLLVADQPGMDAFYLHPEMTASYTGRAMVRAVEASLPLPRRALRLLSLLPSLGLRNWLRRL